MPQCGTRGFRAQDSRRAIPPRNRAPSGPAQKQIHILLQAPRPGASDENGVRRPSHAGRASVAMPLLDDGTASPASRRVASARPALAPKCEAMSAQAVSAHFSQGFAARRCRRAWIQGGSGAFQPARPRAPQTYSTVYVEEPDGAQRSRQERMRRRSGNLARNAG